MPDFSSLLKQPAGGHKRPPTLPAGDYPFIIKSHEMGESEKKKTPYVRFNLALTGFPSNISEEDQEGIDLSKRQMRQDYYFTEDALWRLDAFIASCGVEANGRSYDELFPELTGQTGIAEIRQKLNQDTNETFAEIKKLTGTGG